MSLSLYLLPVTEQKDDTCLLMGGSYGHYVDTVPWAWVQRGGYCLCSGDRSIHDSMSQIVVNSN